MNITAKNTTISSFLPAIILLVIALCSYAIYKRRKQQTWPPCHSGWIPWLGCAVEFGKSPLTFIDEVRQKLGPVYTLQVAGKRMTFVTEPEDIKTFFHSSKLDFQQAVQEGVQKTGSISPQMFYEHHTKIHDIVKWRLGQSKLLPFCKSLNFKFTETLKEYEGKGKCDLNGLVRTTMYKAVLDNLFGEKVLPTALKDEYKNFEKSFVKFDEDFEYGSKLPPMFLKEWNESKWFLLRTFQQIVRAVDTTTAMTEEETLFETLVKSIQGPCAPNFSMLMMWAALANAIPITFWTIAFILSHPDILMRARKEVDRVAADKGVKPGHDLDLTQDDLNQLIYVKQCILEAIRMRSPGIITRGVTEDIRIGKYTVPAGDMLMLSPYWAHRNPKFFPNPEEFQPERWRGEDLEKNLFLEGFVAFGGGRYQCPGRWFALMEMQIYVSLILHKMDFKLLEPVPKHSSLHIVGTQQPEGSMNVSYSIRI